MSSFRSRYYNAWKVLFWYVAINHVDAMFP
jgi:hypothetical protein